MGALTDQLREPGLRPGVTITAWRQRPLTHAAGESAITDEELGLGSQGSYASFVRLGERLLSVNARTPVAGLEEFFVKLLAYWNLSEQEGGRLLRRNGSDGALQVRRIGRGLTKIEGPDEKDRLIELFTIRKILTGLYRSKENENRWLRQPSQLLDNHSPLELLLNGSWFNLLRVRQYLQTVAGL